MFAEITRLLIVFLATALGYDLSRGSHGSYPLLGATLGACIGYVIGGLAGRFLRRTATKVEKRAEDLPPARLLAGALGGVAGGGLAGVMTLPLGFVLPSDVGWPIFTLVVWVGGYFGAVVGASRADALLGLAGLSSRPLIKASPYGAHYQSDAHLLDTSAIIDGRVLPLVRTGLLKGDLLVPCFVLDELQGIADGADPVRRRRGRRGLDLLDYLKTYPGVEVHVLDDEVPEHAEVDAKLVSLGRRIGCGIVTVDQPLQKVAELQGVSCLNPELLSDVLREAYVPGETMNLSIVRTGREDGQGVGFLPDGTMVVVGDAAGLVGSEVEVRVTGNLSTSVGLLLFASLVGSE
ncbi:MAG: hypothetical protein ACYCS7_15425 [Acidimicrobiales bacterium]